MTFDEAIDSWEATGAVDSRSLTDARLQAHWAAQIIGGVGAALVPHEPDDSHTSMSWLEEPRMLAGVLTSQGYRVALRLADLTMALIDADGLITDTFALDGRTLDESLALTIEAIERHVGRPPTSPVIPKYEMPAHPVSEGRAFSVDGAALEELARWYANAARFEAAVHESTLGAGPVRSWPHHFDIATLVALDRAGTEPGHARFIGFGLSPGDASYDEPYFYVNPWPAPENRNSPFALDGGAQWHTAGWFGAVLPAGRILRGSGREQAKQVMAYARSAFAANRAILGTL